MRKPISGLGTCLAFGLVVGSAMAAPAPLTGSDEMIDLTRALISHCVAAGTPAQSACCSEMRYIGGGSTTGEADMINGTSAGASTGQIIAPMSRELNKAACIATPVAGNPPRQTTAKGWLFGLDAVSLIANVTAGEAGTCDTAGADGFGANPVDGFPAGGDSITLANLAWDNGKAITTFSGGPRQPLGAGDSGILCKGCGVPTSLTKPTDTNQTTYTFGDIKLPTAGNLDPPPIPGTAWQDVLRILYTGATNRMGAMRIGSETVANAALAPTVNGTNQKIIEQFCGGDLRRSLVAAWTNIIDGCAGGGSTACVGAPVRRLLRRGDTSGTADTLLELLNLPPIRNNPSPVQSGVPVPGSPFCNGNDQRDNDPIRVPCSPAAGATAASSLFQDMNCNRYVVDDKGNGDTRDDEVSNSLGLLIPIFVPEELPTPPNIGGNPALPATLGGFASGTFEYENQRKFPRPTCSTGGVMFTRAPTDPDTGLTLSTCPDGTPALGGLCQVPITSGGTGSSAACIAKPGATNLPGAVTSWFAGAACSGLPDPDGVGPMGSGCNAVRPDVRVYNAVVRDPSPTQPAAAPAGYIGRITQYSRVIVGQTAQPNRELLMALYRVRQTSRGIGTPDVCASDSSTLTLGCIAGNYTATNSIDCALGFASRVAATAPNAVAMKLDSVTPTDLNIRSFEYPISRGLYINTLTNVPGADPGAFRPGPAPGAGQCYSQFLAWLDANPATVDATLATKNFVPVPLGAGGLICVDFRANQLDPRFPPGGSNQCPSPDTVNACL